jgi:hypothetical protein
MSTQKVFSGAGGVAQVVEHKCESLSSKPSPTREKKIWQSLCYFPSLGRHLRSGFFFSVMESKSRALGLLDKHSATALHPSHGKWISFFFFYLVGIYFRHTPILTNLLSPLCHVTLLVTLPGDFDLLQCFHISILLPVGD